MKFKLNNRYVRWGVTAFLVIVASIIFYYLMFHNSSVRFILRTFIDILMPVVFGMVIAYLMSPVLNYIEGKLLVPICNKLGIKPSKRRGSVVRVIGVLLTTFLFVTIIYLIIYMMVSQLIPSIQNIIDNFDYYTNNVINWINKTLDDNPEIRDYAVRVIDQSSDQLDHFLSEDLPNNITVWLRTVTNTAANILGVLWDFLIGFIISFYMMANKEKFSGQAKKIAYAMFERDTANIVIRNFRFTHQTFIGFLGGKLADSIIIGLICFMGTTLMHTPYAALVSMVIGVTNIIPFFGPFLGAVPSAILILIVDLTHPMNCVYFLIFVMVLQQFDGNFLGPKILGNSTGLASFWVIFAITFFGGLFGVMGMIVGVPIFAVVYAAIKSLVNTALIKKELPTETNLYEKLEYMDDEGFHDYQPTESSRDLRKKKDRKKEKNKTNGPSDGGAS